MAKVPCQKCGVLILPATAERNGGVCVPCKNGTRESLEKSRAYYQEQRELDRTDPERLLWRALVDRVYHAEGGFNALSEHEQKYYVGHILLGEVYNGGFEQFFSNSSGEYYVQASEILLELGAQNSLRLLRQAKDILFPSQIVPTNTTKRRELLAANGTSYDNRLDALDSEFYKDPDALYERLAAYGREHGLF